MLKLPLSSWCTREIWAPPLAAAPSLPERQGRTTLHRWEKKAPAGARRRRFSSWEEREKNPADCLAKKPNGCNGHWLLRTCALLWMAAVSMLSCHTHCRSVRRIWYSVSPNQLLVSSRRPPMSAGSHGWCRRRKSEVSCSITHLTKSQTGSKDPDSYRDLTALSVKVLGAGRFVIITSECLMTADDSWFFSRVRNIFQQLTKIPVWLQDILFVFVWFTKWNLRNQVRSGPVCPPPFLEGWATEKPTNIQEQFSPVFFSIQSRFHKSLTSEECRAPKGEMLWDVWKPHYRRRVPGRIITTLQEGDRSGQLLRARRLLSADV